MRSEHFETLSRTAFRPLVNSPEHRPFLIGYVGFAATFALLVLATLLSDFQMAANVVPAILQLLVLLAAGACLRRLGRGRIALGIDVFAVLTGFSACATLLSLILASTALPFVDDALARADALLFGRDTWSTILAISRGWPTMMKYLSAAYETLNLQPIILIPALLWVGAGERLRTFTTAWMVSLTITLFVAPLFPAQAAYLHFGIAQSSVPGIASPVAWEHIQYLSALRSGELRTIGMDTLYGIVTFPSFHAAGAIMLGWGFYGCKPMRWPMIGLNIAVFISAIFIGGHYLVDLVAGTIIAITSLGIAARVSRFERGDWVGIARSLRT